MENLAGHALEANIGGVDALEANIGGVDALEANIGGVDALEANIGGVDALEANIGGVDALEANIVGVSMLRGADGITPHIGENGNWYLDETDTGKPSRGEAGPQGLPGIYYGTTQPAGDTHPVWIDPDGDHDDGGLLPAVTSADNGKVLRVVGGAWAAAEISSANGVSF